MTICTHELCGKEKSIWCHTKDVDSSVKKHRYCVQCGVIQNISDDRPKALGFWMNLLGSLSRQLGLTQSQKRLIAKSIEQHAYLSDGFGSFGSSQKLLFKTIVSSYCDTSSVDIDTLLSVK